MLGRKKQAEKLFWWKGINQDGFCVCGKELARNKAGLELILRKKNINMLVAKRMWSGYFLARVNREDITLFSREMATLINAGIPLCGALEIAKNGIKKWRFKMMLSAMQKEVEEGAYLADALREWPEFDKVFCSLVRTGEQSGTLCDVFSHLAIYRENMQRLYSSVQKSLLYPSMIFFVSIFVLGFLFSFVIPQFFCLFKNVGMALPAFTVMVVEISKYFVAYGLYYLIGLMLTIFCIKIALQKSYIFKYFFGIFVLKLPFLGDFLSNIIFSRCFRTVAMLVQAGLPLLDALRIAANISNHVVFHKRFSEIADQLMSGQSIYLCFKNSGKFPYRVMQLIHVGEESGCLDKMLLHLSEHFEDKVKCRIQHLEQLLEPVMMIFLSLIVGVVVISMYLPIFHLGAVV